MTRNIIVSSLLVFIILIFGCLEKSRHRVNHDGNPRLDTTIFLFDVKQYNRDELALFVEKLSAQEPAVIAMNVFFPSPKRYKEDSVFQQSIVHSGRVILCATIENNNEINHSNPWFLQSALDEGVISFLIDEDGAIREYQPLFDGREKQMGSFPDMIAYHYDPRTMFEFDKFKIDEVVSIHYVKSLADFPVLNSDSIASYKIKGKIVILDDLTPAEFKYLVPDNDGNLYRARGFGDCQYCFKQVGN